MIFSFCSSCWWVAPFLGLEPYFLCWLVLSWQYSTLTTGLVSTTISFQYYPLCLSVSHVKAMCRWVFDSSFCVPTIGPTIKHFLIFQLLVAQILSTIYALIMMAVIVGTALQLREDGIGSPSAIFLIAMLSSFFIAALLHPQEFSCIIFFSIYLLSIPSMYLLLILYSIINLNIVTWGTREVQVKKTKKVKIWTITIGMVPSHNIS